MHPALIQYTDSSTVDPRYMEINMFGKNILSQRTSVKSAQGMVIVKDARSATWFWRPLARYLLFRELCALKRIQGLERVPQFLGRLDECAFAMSRLEGVPLDKEGFLRSVRSLVQTSGRASRNANGLVIMYADRVTASMQITLDLTEKRRKKQEAYNKKHGIVPKTIFRKIAPSFAPVELNDMLESDSYTAEETPVYESVINMEEKIVGFEVEMHEAAEKLKKLNL